MRNPKDEDPSMMLRNNFESVAKAQDGAINARLSSLGKELFGLVQAVDETKVISEDIQHANEFLGSLMFEARKGTWFIDVQTASPTLATADVAQVVLRQMFAITHIAETLEVAKKVSRYITAFGQAARAVQLGSKAQWEQLAIMSKKAEEWKDSLSKYVKKAPHVAKNIKTTIASTQDYLKDAKTVVTNKDPMYNTIPEEQEKQRLEIWDELYERRQGIVHLKAVIEYYGSHPITKLDWSKKDREDMLRGLDGLLKTIEEIRLFMKRNYPTVNGQKRLTKHRYTQVEFNENSELAQYRKEIEKMEENHDRWHY